MFPEINEDVQPIVKTPELLKGWEIDPQSPSGSQSTSMDIHSNFASGSYQIKSEFHSGDANGWARGLFSAIINPHDKGVLQWNRVFVISCLVAILVDPMFFLLQCVQKENKCIVLNQTLRTTMTVLRSVTDIFYFLHILLQFRIFCVAPESRTLGAGDFVDNPRRVALHYLKGYFLVDVLLLLPIPQIMAYRFLPKYVGLSAENGIILIQYIPRVFRFLPLLAGWSPYESIFASSRANFVINLLLFLLAGHAVGSCWYLFGLQRVNQCLQDACSFSHIKDCKEFIDCGYGDKIEKFRLNSQWTNWQTNSNASACFNKDGSFTYGIYGQAPDIAARPSIVIRYLYSMFWGFQQISTVARSLVPSYLSEEVIFTMVITGLSLLLFFFLIGNTLNFLQGFRLRKVGQYERLRAATRGVSEEALLKMFSEELQTEIRHHLFEVVKKEKRV